MRLARGDTLEGVAAALRLSPAQLSKLENGKARRPNLGAILALQEYYGVPNLDVLFADFIPQVLPAGK